MYTCIYLCLYVYVCIYVQMVCIHTFVCINVLILSNRIPSGTGWRRWLGYLKLLVSVRKRDIHYRALLRKVIYKDKAPSASSTPCIRCVYVYVYHHLNVYCYVHLHLYLHLFLSPGISCVCKCLIILQYSATLCCTLQHTATHYNTLQHTASVLLYRSLSQLCVHSSFPPPPPPPHAHI